MTTSNAPERPRLNGAQSAADRSDGAPLARPSTPTPLCARPAGAGAGENLGGEDTALGPAKVIAPQTSGQPERLTCLELQRQSDPPVRIPDDDHDPAYEAWLDAREEDRLRWNDDPPASRRFRP